MIDKKQLSCTDVDHIKIHDDKSADPVLYLKTKELKNKIS